ncbi:hypothetical protein IQ260_07220 [Leptolyngbya cf. ectocarpi LEGE 11479]|uniref:Uncharacterized protein n=1 Tax=Leptolyngbya cf. ectocarpi LEGE 11479 TaxID=1828722 RepID=A0A928X2N1_LEPEC|nr:hypothetical protein [Leptolyngbya ectocarpi]MBE9066439.1 hypothetical protein [Leptolyngbya cf. ectocarpi LEGE 11479]
MLRDTPHGIAIVPEQSGWYWQLYGNFKTGIEWVLSTLNIVFPDLFLDLTESFTPLSVTHSYKALRIVEQWQVLTEESHILRGGQLLP